jgi:MFS family permease
VPASRGPDRDGFDRRLVAPLVLGALLNPINTSMIAVALVPIGAALGEPPARTAWLVSGLYLATAVGQPVVGRLVDRHGPRLLYLLGTALVGVAGLLGALAPDLSVLVAARVLLGIGTCAGYPAAMYLIRSESERTGLASPSGVLTVLAVTTQTTAVVGPTLGGVLIGVGGWRTVFAVNVPLALTCLALGALRLPRTPAARAGEPRDEGVDLPGMVLFAATLTALLLFLMSPSPGHVYLLVAGVVVGAALTARELRVDAPFLELRVLGGNRALLATFARTVLTFTVTYGFIYGFTQWLEDGRGLSPSQAGLVLLPMFLVAIVVAWLSGRRPAVRGKLVVGGVVLAAGSALLLLLDSASSVVLLVTVTLVVGVPQGLNSLANQNALYHQADPERMGSSAGLQRTFTYLGAMVSEAAVAASFTDSDAADTAGLHRLAWFMVVVALVLVAVTVGDRSLVRVGARETSGQATGSTEAA